MVARLFTALCFAVFLLSDLYYEGIGRPFDYLGIAAAALWLTLGPRGPQVSRAWSMALPLVVIVAPWCITGAINGYVLSSLAIFVGALIVYPFGLSSQNYVDEKTIAKSINIIIAVGVSFLYFQIVYFYVIGNFVDFTDIMGSRQSRGFNESLSYFRASGIFQEPNAYCAVMFCLLSIVSTLRFRSLFVELAAISSMILSQSLWGIVGSIVVLWLLYGAKRAAIIAGASSIVLVIAALITHFPVEDFLETSVTFSRITNIQDDASQQGRYGDFENIKYGIDTLIGNGVDTSNFQEFGANGITFLIYSFGILGTVCLSLYFIIAVGVQARILIPLLFIITTYPPFSYMYFWFWLGLLSRPGRALSAGMVPQQPPSPSARLLSTSNDLA
jgi:hypothetical protein